MGGFCIYCGRKGTPENPVVNSVCLECRIRRNELVYLESRTFYFDLCKTCGSLKLGYRWINTDGFEAAIDYVVHNYVSKKIRPLQGVEDVSITDYQVLTTPSWHTDVEIIISGKYGGKAFNIPVRITIYFHPTKCPRCTMYDSREYEALLQIRGISINRLKKIIDDEFMREPRIARDFIEAIEVRNGLDIYFFTQGAARKLARRLSHRLGMKIKENYEVVGTRSGKSRARIHISLRKD